jgi:hypothetical protein
VRRSAGERRVGPRTLPPNIRRLGDPDIESVMEALLQLRLSEMDAHETLALSRAVARRDGLGPLSAACHSLLLLHVLGLEEEAKEALRVVLQAHQAPAEREQEARVM